MMETENSSLCAIFSLLGIIIGCCIFSLVQKLRLTTFKKISRDIIAKAESDANTLKVSSESELKKKFHQQEKELEAIWTKEKRKFIEQEERIKQKEENLEKRTLLIEKKIINIEGREAHIQSKNEQIEKQKAELQAQQQTLIEELEILAGLSASEAKDILLEKVSADIKVDAAHMIRKTLIEAKEEAEHQATSIIATAINRLAVSCVSETTINTITLPSEEMKGRIIGRDGRNIRALERATGINFIIDDTPNAVVLSGFDPLRLHIAKLTLHELIKDGRIHPTRIEEAVTMAKLQIKKQIKHFGEDAALRAGIMNLHPEIITLLGKLKFRHSYGQNVLEHSLEVAHIMGLMATELGIDSDRAKRIGLLHDMGKAVSHEIQGTHAIIGHDLALKYGESKYIANGIGCHHYEMEPLCIEASLCSSADKISAARLGARREDFEEYIKRHKKLEEIAYQYPGIDKAYALQAGRELLIFVRPDQINDDGIINLARDLTKKIQRDLNYPGKIKVSISRETRIVEYAM